jgi:hypothetical protein
MEGWRRTASQQVCLLDGPNLFLRACSRQQLLVACLRSLCCTDFCTHFRVGSFEAALLEIEVSNCACAVCILYFCRRLLAAPPQQHALSCTMRARIIVHAAPPQQHALSCTQHHRNACTHYCTHYRARSTTAMRALSCMQHHRNACTHYRARSTTATARIILNRNQWVWRKQEQGGIIIYRNSELSMRKRKMALNVDRIVVTEGNFLFYKKMNEVCKCVLFLKRHALLDLATAVRSLFLQSPCSVVHVRDRYAVHIGGLSGGCRCCDCPRTEPTTIPSFALVFARRCAT